MPSQVIFSADKLAVEPYFDFKHLL